VSACKKQRGAYEKSDRKKFIQAMKEIKHFQKETYAASKALQVLAPSSFIIVEHGQKLLYEYTVLAAKAYFPGKEKAAHEWIEWFMYECDMGKKPMEARINDKPFPVRNFGELYDVIMA